jgi:hypothetical protein
VYVQAAPPATSTAVSQGSAASDTLTIEEPPPPPAPVAPPAASSPAAVTPSRPAARRPAKPRTDSHTEESASAPDTTPGPDSAQAPLLQPASSAASQDEIAARQSGVRRRIDGLNNRYDSSPEDRQVLEDARAFVNQSERALKEHNLLKAQELAEKASLLLDALEAKP